MTKRPDFVNDLPDGSTEQLFLKAHQRADGSLSLVRKVVGPNGDTQEVWHEVYDRQGRVLHRHQHSVRKEGP